MPWEHTQWGLRNEPPLDVSGLTTEVPSIEEKSDEATAAAASQGGFESEGHGGAESKDAAGGDGER